MGYTLRSFCLSLLLLLLYSSAWASTILSADDRIKYVSADGAISDTDMLTLAPANQAGISVNRFTSFDVSDRSLRLVNVASSSGSDITAGLIVIIADDITLKNAIEVVGPASDVLFLSSDSGGTLSCQNCHFENINRLTFAVAEGAESLNGSSVKVGTVETIPDGIVSIHNLRAPGALAVEFLADRVSLSGTVSSHLKVNDSFFGGYEQDLNGSHTMGAGGVHALIGNIAWAYDEQAITSIAPTQAGARSLHGKIQAVNFKVITGRPLTIDSRVDTRTDILSSVRYRGELYVVEEGVEFVNLSESPLDIIGTITSEGRVSAKSTSRLTVASGSTIEGRDVDLIAAQDFINNGQITADELDIAGANVRNRQASLEAFFELNIWAEHNLYNEFGGRVRGNLVNLQAEKGLIRNGSRTPYIPKDHEVSAPLDFGWQDVEEPNPLEIGTFYKSGMNVDVSPSNGYPAPEDHSAFIVANVLKVKANAFENINPYWQRIPEDGSPLTLDRSRLNQVTVSAEDYLDFQLQEYMVNSSAVIHASGPDNRSSIKAKVIANERYRTMVALEETSSSSQVRELDYGTFQEETEKHLFSTKNYAFSPPGVIATMGHLNLGASVGFINSTSYFEVFGDASFDNETPSIIDLGITNEEVEHLLTIRTRKICGYNSWGRPISCNYEDGRNTSVTIQNPDSLDSLFYVHGDASGKQARFFPLNLRSFNLYLKQSLFDRFARGGLSIDQQKEVNGNQRTLKGDFVLDENNAENIHVKSWYEEDGEKVASSERTDQFSLINEIKRVIQKIAEAVESLFDEVMSWWN